MQREFKRTSKRARDLLNRAEGADVDFKASPAGLGAEDLVAFANSLDGGAVLLGVEEMKNAKGIQRGAICGCSVDDRTRQTVLNKALSCAPPVEIEVFVENVSAKPFLRVEVPSGPRKPYATSGGTFKIRGDGQNRPLTPAELLSVFLEVEEAQFVDRFQAAANALSKDIEGMQSAWVSNFIMATSSIEDEVDRMKEEIGQLGRALAAQLDGVLQSAEDAVGRSDEAAAMIVDVHDTGFQLLAGIEELQRDQALLDERVRALLHHSGVEDPEERRARGMVNASVKILLEKYPDSTLEDFAEIISHLEVQYGGKPKGWVRDALVAAKQGARSGT